MPARQVTLQALVDGGLGEDFDREFERVLENIRDLNTDEKATRTITIKIGVKPLDESRQDVVLTEKCDANLAGSKKHKTVAHIDDAGCWTNNGADPRQRDAFEDADDPAVTPISKNQEQKG